MEAAEPVVSAELLRLGASEIADLIAKHPIPLDFVVLIEEVGSGVTIDIIDATDTESNGPGFKTELPLPLLSIAVNQNEMTVARESPPVDPKSTLGKAVVRGFFYWYTGTNVERKASALTFPSVDHITFSSMVNGNWHVNVARVPRTPGDFLSLRMSEGGTILSVLQGL